MQGSQDESPQCNLLGRKLCVEESFTKSAKRIENVRLIGKPPKFTLGQFPRRRPIHHFPSHTNNRIDPTIQRYKLCLRCGCRDGIGIDPDSGQAQQPCCEIRRSPTTEWIEYPVIRPCTGCQHIVGKAERKHREIWTDGIECDPPRVQF